MEVGVVRVAEDEDFDKLKKLVDNHEGWKLEYNKPSIRVWTRCSDDRTTSFKLIKVVTVFSDVEPPVLYDVLHDPDYRKEWDTHMLCSEDIGFLNINNDVGYYASKYTWLHKIPINRRGPKDLLHEALCKGL